MIENKRIMKGDVYLVNLGVQSGTIINGIRPVVIVQNNMGNTFSPNVIVCPVTTQMKGLHLPTHVQLPIGTGGLERESQALTEMVITLEKDKLIRHIGNVGDVMVSLINRALMVSLELA